ncbi:MAG TPA: hypothetical protein VFG10_19000 [Saprospiraceae bacterium]|nr:hypothetical protein [Saprospiraceae bacterium]
MNTKKLKYFMWKFIVTTFLHPYAQKYYLGVAVGYVAFATSGSLLYYLIAILASCIYNEIADAIVNRYGVVDDNEIDPQDSPA